MKYIRSKEDSLKLGLSLFLLAGSVAGTIFCNRMTAEMKQELMILSQSSVMQTMPEEINSLDLCRTCCLLTPLTKYTKRFTQFATW